MITRITNEEKAQVLFSYLNQVFPHIHNSPDILGHQLRSNVGPDSEQEKNYIYILESAIFFLFVFFLILIMSQFRNIKAVP
jgi:hypothetical protein